MLIILGSTSPLKEEAVKVACMSLDLIAAITNVVVASQVSAQPVGWEETLTGARNRARGAHAHAPGALALGIENGIRWNENHWEDFAIIVAIRPDGQEFIFKSAVLPFPTNMVEIAATRGFVTTTVGQVLAEHFGSNPNDPHSFLTHGLRSRVSILAEAIASALTALSH